jgi:hypothetical protein
MRPRRSPIGALQIEPTKTEEVKMKNGILVRTRSACHVGPAIIAWLIGLTAFAWAPLASAYYFVPYTTGTAATGLNNDGICNLTEAIYSINHYVDSYGCVDNSDLGHPDPSWCDQGVLCGRIYRHGWVKPRLRPCHSQHYPNDQCQRRCISAPVTDPAIPSSSPGFVGLHHLRRVRRVTTG